MTEVSLRRFAALAAATAVVVAIATPSLAATGALSRSIRIEGFVPEICRADFNATPAPLGAQVVSLGSDSEFCNASRGYAVVANYAGGRDPGALIVDGHVVPLSVSGHTIIAVQRGPASLTRQISYRPGATPITTLRVSVDAGAI